MPRTVLGGNAEGVPIEKEILREIRSSGLRNYQGFQVVVEVEAGVDDFSAMTNRDERNAVKPAVLREKKGVVVTFRIPGTGGILKKHVPETDPNLPVSPVTGDVMIQMKRANDVPGDGRGVDCRSNEHRSGCPPRVRQEHRGCQGRDSSVAESGRTQRRCGRRELSGKKNDNRVLCG
jgi:hypothetical protein